MGAASVPTIAKHVTDKSPPYRGALSAADLRQTTERMRILAIDPGNELSAFCMVENGARSAAARFGTKN